MTLTVMVETIYAEQVTRAERVTPLHPRSAALLAIVLTAATLAGGGCSRAAAMEPWNVTPSPAAAAAEGVRSPRAFDPAEGVEIARSNADSAALPERVLPTDPRVRFIGRFVTTEAKTRRFAWSNSAIELTTDAPEINLLLRDGATDKDAPNYFQIIFDDDDRAVLRLSPGRTVYRVPLPKSKGPHRVAVVKRTEADVGTVELLGLQLPEGGTLLEQPAGRPHTLLALGDSITTGYGNTYSAATDMDSKTGARVADWSVRTENAYLSFGAMAARALGADYISIAYSGKGIHQNQDGTDPVTFPALLTRALPVENKTLDVPETPLPDAVLVNLGSNDFLNRKTRIPHDPFVASFRSFLGDVRARWPRAPIFCTVGPMLENKFFEARLDKARAYVKDGVAARRDLGDKEVFYFDVAPQDREHDGMGADYHPNLITHAKMARQVAAALRPTLGW